MKNLMKMLAAVDGSIPQLSSTGTLTGVGELTVLVTKTGLSGVAEVSVTHSDGTVILAATALTSGTPQALLATFGNLTITWDGRLVGGDNWSYRITAGVASDFVGDVDNRSGIWVPIVVSADGKLEPVPSPITDPVFTSPALLTERVKQVKVGATGTAALTTFSSPLHKIEMTNRATAILFHSFFGNEDGVDQVVTNSIASGVTEGGDLDVIVTALGMAGTPKTITCAVAATKQQESITCTAGESTGAGDITMAVTAAGMVGSPHDVVVPVSLSDGVNDVGLALRTALAADAVVALFFDVSGATDTAILTAKTAAANDATMALGFTDTDSTGVTFGASADTTAGVAPDDAAGIAEKVKDALNADGVIGVFFVATRSGDDVILTAAAAADNDTTMNLAVEEGTASGFTDSLTSVQTTEGYAVGTWDELGGSGTFYDGPPEASQNNAPFSFIWLKSNTAGPNNVLIRGWKESS